MAIKAIVNNTEKEIEQIKNSDEQDIDYVYSRIGDTEVEGEPPISIKSIGGNLSNYRIYGNTVSGESVGDMTANGYKVPVIISGINLFDESVVVDKEVNTALSNYQVYHQGGILYINGVTTSAQVDVEIANMSGINTEALEYINQNYVRYVFTSISPGVVQIRYSITGSENYFYASNRYTSAPSRNANRLVFRLQKDYQYDHEPIGILIKKEQIQSGYEPYHTPVSTNIYLPEPIKMVGDVAEYIDYAEQKQHRVRKNLLKITLASSGATTYDGVSISNNDGILTLNGTSNNGSFVNLATAIKLSVGNYILTGGSENLMIRFQKTFSSYGFDDTGAGRNIVCPEEVTSGVCTVKLTANYTYNNVKVYPMIRKADIEDDTYEPYITNTELNVTLPALPTIKGTNILSVNTSIQPSNIYIKDNFDYKKVFTATRAIEGESPLNYKNIEDNDSTLKNYRIYGQTVDGESVGDRTGNLFDISKATRDVGHTYNGDGDYVTSASNTITGFIAVDENTTYTIKNTGYPPYRVHYFDINKQWISRTNPLYDMETSPGMAVEFTTPNNSKYIIMQEPDTNRMNLSTIMLNTGSEPLPYEPYGYRVPVTVTNGTDTETTNIYLPEQIKMVGDEAEYIDYAEQKQHRVRKNLVQTIATSQTINDITFTVNANGSVTCNGTNHGNNPILFELNNPDVVFPEGVYITSGCPAGGSITSGYKIQYFNGSSWNYELGSGSTFTLSGNLKYRSRILISKDITVTNLTFYPMLRLASIEDDTYEPYIENTEVDVILPGIAVTAGTNTLTVGTEVQPSNIYIKGKIKSLD